MRPDTVKHTNGTFGVANYAKPYGTLYPSLCRPIRPHDRPVTNLVGGGDLFLHDTQFWFLYFGGSHTGFSHELFSFGRTQVLLD